MRLASSSACPASRFSCWQSSLSGWRPCLISSAAIRHYDKLSFGEQVALQVSEQRVVLYDQELATLDHLRQHHKISTDDYHWKSATVVFYIQQEAQFQNNILYGRPPSLDVVLPEGVSNVLRSVGKYSLGISVALLEGILKGGGNFSP